MTGPVRRAVALARADGVAALGQRVLRRAYQRWGDPALDFPIDVEDIRDSRSVMIRRPAAAVDGPASVGWLMTPPARGSGGHTTIFRMIEALERAGHRCELVIHDRYGGDLGAQTEVIRQGWPDVRAGVRPVSEGFAGLDVCFATSWASAHVLAARCRDPLRPMYFVQDYEPYFYPHGSEYTLAEDTYRFGYDVVTVGHGVAAALANRHGVTADVVEFGCDTDVYRLTNRGARRGVVCYMRPGVARRGYLHTVAALREFHARHPEHPIHVFGRPAGELPFPVENHGTLSPGALNDLYNMTITGLAMSFTNMTLIAEEMLAAGNIPVVNDTEIGRAGLADPHVRWAEPTPHAMAAQLCAAVEAADVPGRAAAAAADARPGGWSAGQATLVAAVRRVASAPRSRPDHAAGSARPSVARAAGSADATAARTRSRS